MLQALELLYRLKSVPRTGWLDHEVCGKGTTRPRDVESVSEHSHTTALLAMMLCPPELDRLKVIEMALLHDCTEAVCGDITPEAYSSVTAEDKQAREEAALTQVCASVNAAGWQGDRIHALWTERETGLSPEGSFVSQIDKLDMLVQAHLYETEHGVDLSEFFSYVEKRGMVTHPALTPLYDTVRQGRGGEAEAEAEGQE
ncbi:hypothetical protein KIPB_009806 [Kipferlia bialata]|uniref:5'-deoxynucleotidase n=1 Tax=Kipferlia bialata TaxID=797122 RepID=A0A9K3D3R0_9EUKA|nr:hypothetical protein KIPB_009806 [Kipferlia bialata]|eukprot:g9806.t1